MDLYTICLLLVSVSQHLTLQPTAYGVITSNFQGKQWQWENDHLIKMWERAMFESSLPEMKTKATHWWSWEKSKVFFAGITRGFITRRLNVWLNTPQKFFNRSQGEKHHMRPVHCHAPKGIRDPLHQCRAWQWVEGFHLEIRVLLPSL